MNKRIVVLLSAALVLAFVIQTSAAFAVQSPVLTPEPTRDFPMPKPTRDFPTPFIPDPPPLTPSPPKSDLLLPRYEAPVSDDSVGKYYRFEFRLGDLGDDLWEAIERWLKERGITI